MSRERVFLWLLRGIVFVLPFSVGWSFIRALATHQHLLPIEIALWILWAVLLLASFVPAPAGLTTLRVSAVSGIAAGFWPLTHHVGAWPETLGIVVGLGFVILTFSYPVAEWCVNGSAYPNERRYMLRVPTPLLFGPLLIGVGILVGVPFSVIALAPSHPLVAIAIAVIGSPVVYILANSVHKLSRRWVVFVPAGLVVHDPMSLIDPVLFQRPLIERFSPAARDTDALDLRQNAIGTAIELDLHEKVPMALVKPFRPMAVGSSARLMITPTRATAVLREAKARKIPIA